MAFSIIPPPAPWIDVTTGMPTRPFYRFMVDLFNAAGGGQVSFDDVILLLASAQAQSDPVLGQEIAGLATVVAGMPPTDQGSLEQGIADLQRHFATLPLAPPPINADDLTVLALAAGIVGSAAGSGAVSSVTGTDVLHAAPTTGAVIISLDTGTSGHVVPVLDGSGIAWSGAATMSVNGAGGLAVAFGLSCTTFACAVGAASGNFTIGGSSTIAGSLNVTGGVSATTGAFTGLNATNATIANITVTGATATFNNNASVLGSLAVAANLSATNAAFATLDVAGAVSVHGAVATMSGGLNVTAGGASVTGGLAVNNGAAISGGLAVAGAFAPVTDNAISCGDGTHRFTDIFAVSGSVNPSDMRLKGNLVAIPACLPIIESQEPITWEWSKKEWIDGRRHWGFNAKALADAVAETGLDWAGHLVDEQGIHNLRDHEIMPIVWQGLRELAARVRRLEGFAA